ATGAAGAAGAVASLPVPPSALSAPSPCTSQSPGPRLMRRLTAPQLATTMKDLFFRDATVPVLTVFSDPTVLGFASDADALLVQGLNAQQLSDYAETVAHWAVTQHLSQLSSCTTTDATCRQQFIRAFGRRAFREPLTDDRVKPYDTLFAAEASFADGAEAVVSAMLQSPYFLYRRELGAPGAGTTVALTPHEVASSLSYLLTGSMPDDQLAQAADAGQLATPQQLDQQVARLLQDPRANDTLMSFLSGWLGLERLNTVVKDDSVFIVSPTLKAAMAGETRAFLLDAFARNAPVSELFSAKHSFLNQDLANFYGVTPSDGTQLQSTFTKVIYGNGHRDPGLLGQASLLAGYADAAISSPVLRGKLVRTRLLCQNIPPPPANVDTKLKPNAAAKTTREHFAQHDQDGVCAACHHLMDPIGYGFEHYDAFGRWRDQENGAPIDATGTIFGTKTGDVAFDGVAQLSAYLATSADVKTCLVRLWSYASYGTAGWTEDACTYDAINTSAGQYGLRDVLTAIIHAPHFSQRLRSTP
ncbi:MAG: hypothetical protein JWM82_3407, partial [Myxococcales bacterium]|nr:hypothetical protein [Myxococcales bacterium]